MTFCSGWCFPLSLSVYVIVNISRFISWTSSIVYGICSHTDYKSSSPKIRCSPWVENKYCTINFQAPVIYRAHFKTRFPKCCTTKFNKHIKIQQNKKFATLCRMRKKTQKIIIKPFTGCCSPASFATGCYEIGLASAVQRPESWHTLASLSEIDR